MKTIVGIFKSVSKAKEAIDTLKASGLDADNIQLISKYALLTDEESSVYVDPNANIFNLDNNGLDVPLGEEVNAAFNGEMFTKKMQSILTNTSNSGDIKATIERTE